MRGYLLRRAGASLIVLLVASMLVFARRARAAGRPGARARRRGPQPEGAHGDPRRSTASTSRCRSSTSTGWATSCAATSARPRGPACRRRQHDRRPPAGHARARVPEPARGDRDRALARGSSPRCGAAGARTTSGNTVGARRAVGAALLARPDADPDLLDRRSGCCPPSGFVAARRGPDRQPAPHAAAGDRARHRLRGGDLCARRARRCSSRSSADYVRTARAKGLRERCRRRRPRAAQQPR